MIGISFYFGFDLPQAERVRLFKTYGIDCVITNADMRFKDCNGKFEDQVKILNENGLKLSSLHMVYKTKELPNFWKKGIKGYILTKRLKKDIRTAHKYGFNSVVAHFIGDYSKVGEKRILSVLKLCEKLNVPLAVENIDCQKVFLDIFENIKHPYLKFCYDSGHNNVFDKGFDYLGKFGDKLVALHLHDNMGEHDDHTLNVFGTIDWDKIARELAKLPPVNLDYELLLYKKCDLTPEEVVDTVVKQGKELQFLIDKYRKEYIKKVTMKVE